jgi:hypothetical protein
VCRFRVVAGKAKLGRGALYIVRSCREASRHHLLEYWLFPTGRLNLGFLLREKLATIFIKPSLGVSQLAGHLLHHLHANKFSSTIQYRTTNKFFWRRCWGKRRLLQGEFLTHILYFVLSFAFSLFLLASFYQKHKKLVSFIVVISLL